MMTMLRNLIVLLGVSVAGFGADEAGAQAPKVDTPDPATLEVMKLQGIWKAVGFQFAGESQPREKIQGLKCVVRGQQVVHERQGQEETAFTFSVDPSKMPHHMDQITADGKTYHGIYRLTNNTLTICLPTDPNAPRPRQFATKAGDGHVLRIYKKVEEPSSSSRAPGR